MRPQEYYQDQYEQAIVFLKRERPEVDFTRIAMILPQSQPLWAAKGIAEMPWGKQPLFFIGIGKNWIVLSYWEVLGDVLENLARFFAGGF